MGVKIGEKIVAMSETEFEHYLEDKGYDIWTPGEDDKTIDSTVVFEIASELGIKVVQNETTQEYSFMVLIPEYDDGEAPRSVSILQTSVYAFPAMLDRMSFIDRWALMRNNRNENLKEHSQDVTIIALTLAIIFKDIVSPDLVSDSFLYDVMSCAIFHDASEIITGDLPTPIKYRNDQIRTAYKEIEASANNTLLSLLPIELRKSFRAAFGATNIRAGRIVKAADKLSALIKCISEENTGNTEFVSARASIEKALEETYEQLPEAKYFAIHFLPAYGLTLDQITQ